MPEFIRLSTRDYVRRETVDAEENVPVKYRGDLGEEQAVMYSRQLNFWPWGTSGGSMSTGTISVDNRSGRYDQLIYRDLRDQRVTLVIPTKGTAAGGGSSDSGTSTTTQGDADDIVALTAIVDRIEAPNDREVLVHLKDMLTLLDVPLQDEVYGEDADSGVQDRPLPILLGVARSIKPTVWEAEPAGEDGPAMRLHDYGLSGLTNVRDKGVILSPTSSPIGFKLDPRVGNAGIILGADPEGVVTLDASSSGDAIIPPATPDALDGEGQFDTEFTKVDNSNPNDVSGFEFYGNNPLGDIDPYFEPRTSSGETYGYLHGGHAQDSRAILTSDTKILEAGKLYRWEIEIFSSVSYATFINNGIASQGTFVMRAEDFKRTDNREWRGITIFSRRSYDANNNQGVYSGTVQIPDWGDHYLQLGCWNGGSVGFGRIKFEEVPPPPPDELDGITLYDYAKEVVKRAGLPTSLVDKDSIDEVDPNEELIGFYADKPVTALAALRAPLASFAADVFTDRSGTYKFARLRDPSNEIPDRQIDRDVIVRESDVLVYPDEGKGLTTSMTAAKHWYVYRDSDFAESGTGLTLEEKESLKREGRFIRTATLPQEGAGTSSGGSSSGETDEDWPRLYRHAVNAEPMVSLFDEAGAAAAEIQRVIDLYAEVRQFVEVDVWLDPGEFVDLNDVVYFKYPRYRFDDGKNMIVVGVSDTIESSGGRRIASLRLWG